MPPMPPIELYDHFLIMIALGAIISLTYRHTTFLYKALGIFLLSFLLSLNKISQMFIVCFCWPWTCHCFKVNYSIWLNGAKCFYTFEGSYLIKQKLVHWHYHYEFSQNGTCFVCALSMLYEAKVLTFYSFRGLKTMPLHHVSTHYVTSSV